MQTINEQKKATFMLLDENLYRKGNSIYLRIQRDGKSTWRSTGTNELPQAKKWKEKWEHKNWMTKNGFAPKEPASELHSTANDVASTVSVPDSSHLPVDSLMDQYIAAGHPIVKRRTLNPTSATGVAI